MKFPEEKFRLFIFWLCLILIIAAWSYGQEPPPGGQTKTSSFPVIRTPLNQDHLTLFANEISGQMAYNNLVRLAGAPWVREAKEFAGTLADAQLLFDLVRGYGIETLKLERSPSTGSFEYPLEGEFWTLEPELRLLARLGADAALISRGSKTADVTGELIYVPPMNDDEIKRMKEAGPREKTKNKLALVWSLNQEAAKALDAAGFLGVVIFSSRDRYQDAQQVIYSSVPFDQTENLKIGLAVSWKQWSEFLEDLQTGKKIVVRAQARVEKFPDKFEAVFCWIPGTEPEAKGVVFTAHLFEGYLKRGANDDMSGCVVQLEILRTLDRLIKSGRLPRPRRTIYFLWPNEISGTYEFIKQHPGFADKLSVNINMDMVGEALRKNNSLFTMSECPSHLPSFYDGLAKSVLNYIWRTNDVVYLPDSPRGRSGGQYFPNPMLEKNGTNDAFRFFIHRATGGSDHVCFNNPSVAVPGIEFFTWPDQWYHADTDTPDKADPTEMKRVAFLGAATAWAAADCSDDTAGELAEAVSRYGFGRIAERELAAALAGVESAGTENLASETAKALNLVRFGIKRETGALRSIDEISTGSAPARQAVSNRVRQWEMYHQSLKKQVLDYAAFRARQLKAAPPVGLKPDALRIKCEKIVPTVASGVKGREFTLTRFDPYLKFIKDRPDALKALGLTPQQTSMVLNYINGRNSIAEIRDDVSAELGEDLPLKAVAGFVDLLKAVNWIVF